ncbi:hypothetical protein SAMD00019534_115860 [Acytostelium subglobosum LB1]|uniref:hypothetical protein n=1 Tax=Acytostelium subglobosum LB1 TaxID=1410327 RepID=UPI000644EE3D|nr:hypothetical protein SAMD00019534_115860 [Acytostelium subglobosum LB1]GAM28410.1 hypothetical protein SAMD00019534_115860 [Acytostelium subglobosum LB1]|eukprot:XP_012748727.1 hypothetical protein SAMD00019534_115860 [Acytostelium subglobosum LB1]
MHRSGSGSGSPINNDLLNNNTLNNNNNKLNIIQKRTNILKEILSTELAYNTFLSVLVNVYLASLKTMDILSTEEIDSIFANIESIKSANDEMLAKLKSRLDTTSSSTSIRPIVTVPSPSFSAPASATGPLSPDTVSSQQQQPLEVGTMTTTTPAAPPESPDQSSMDQLSLEQSVSTSGTTPSASSIIILSDIFIELGPFLKIYSIFVHNYYNKALKAIKHHTTNSKKFRTFLNQCKYNPQAKKLDLNDLMIMPVQRLPRYILLLEELIQYTPTNESEREGLIAAKLVMKDVVSYVNQTTNNNGGDNDSQISLAVIQQTLGSKAADIIQPNRKLVKSAELDRLVINSEGVPKKKKVTVYLFNDIIVYAVNNKYWRQIQLSEVWIKIRTLEIYNMTCEVFSPTLSCIFLMDGVNTEWPLLIQETINTLLECDQSAKENRLKILENIKEQEGLTFEEKQFFFESMANGGSGTVGGVHSPKTSKRRKAPRGASSRASVKVAPTGVIEDGIVSDRKKRIEQLLLERKNILSMEKDEEEETAVEGGGGVQMEDLYKGATQHDTSSPLATSTPERSSKRLAETTGSPAHRSPSLTSLLPTTKSFQLHSQANRLQHIALMRNDIKKEGYLTKVGNFVKTWKRRWFILENGYLFYLKHQSSTTQLGTIPLLGSTIESVSYESKSFNVVTNNRTYMMVADAEDDVREWITAINQYFDERKSNVQKIRSQFLSSVRPSPSKVGDSWIHANPSARLSTSINSSSDSIEDNSIMTTTTTTNYATTNRKMLAKSRLISEHHEHVAVSGILRKCSLVYSNNASGVPSTHATTSTLEDDESVKQQQSNEHDDEVDTSDFTITSDDDADDDDDDDEDDSTLTSDDVDDN